MENAVPEPVAVVLPLAAPVVPAVPVKIGEAFCVSPLACPVVPAVPVNVGVVFEVLAFEGSDVVPVHVSFAFIMIVESA